MKNSIVAILVLASSWSYAQEVKNSQITGKNFIQELRENALSGGTGGQEGVFEGELENIGDKCAVQLKSSSQGYSELILTAGNGLSFKIKIKPEDLINKVSEEDDGYSVSKYQRGTTSVEVIYMEDTYDKISISTGDTKLTCSWYN